MAQGWWEKDEAVSQTQDATQSENWWAKDEAVKKPRQQKRTGAEPPNPVASPTGIVHDGDTFQMRGGGNARLYGYDAFELDQTGRFLSGNNGAELRPIGKQSRDFLSARVSPAGVVTPTGTQSYGRPVVTLDENGRDLSEEALRAGQGLAAPEYLRKDPDLLRTYMEAERFARLNRQGAHAGQFQSPADFRAGKPDPWAAAEDGHYGNSVAVFPDEPTPFQGLRPEIEQGYMAVAKDPKSTAADLTAYAKANGFQIDPKVADRFIAERNKGRDVADGVEYQDIPQVITNPGDGAVGAGVRGLADPVNMLDEIGAVLDSLGLTDGRENVWTSDRRFGDVLWNNIDQNRAIIAYDEAEHPYSRFGGQLASGLVLPGASVEGVAANAIRETLAAGGSRYAAQQAVKAAVRRRLAVAGSAEGTLAGFGGAEGGIVDRLPSAGVGGLTGAVLGVGGGELLNAAMPIGRTVVNRVRSRSATDRADAVVTRGADDTALASQQIPEEDRWWDADEVISMENEAAIPFISSPRIIDRIDVNDRAQPLLDPAKDMARMQQAERVNPADVLPIPSNEVASLDEAAAISAGQYPPVKAPNEMDELARRDLPSPVDATRSLPKRGPLDLNTFLRTRGGLADQGGELRHMGVTNAGRDLDFAKGEQRFGKLVDNENGMTLDDAADLAWREGYFPDHTERPTVAEFLDAIDNTNRGINRSFRSDDLSEIDAFNNARDQRIAVERGRDEGAPLVEDRGQPVTMGDLEANQPPISAYEEWGENAPDFAGNIRLGKLDSPQEIKRALTVTDQRVGGFDAATRGRIAQAETQELANEIGMTTQQLLSRRNGQAFNAEQALAARQILAKSGNELVNMARAIQRLDDPGEVKLAAFRQAWVRHVAIQEQIAGITAEAGRTLAQFRMIADGRNVRGNVLNALSEGGGGKDRLKAAADLILENADNPGDMNKMAAKALKPKFLDKINEYWINSLLSGPATHVVNAVSNTMTALAQIPEHAVAAGIGGVRQLALQQRRADRVLFSELGARSVGLLQGTKEGLAQAARTFRTGEGSDFGNKVEARMDDAISGLKGKIIRTPTRMLNASDELFKGMARRMELSGLSVRKAYQEGLKGEEAKKRAADLLANPTEEMLDRAFDYGGYLTFQRPLGEGMQSFSRFVQKTPLMKFIVPFVRTPTNLLKFATERSPAAPILKEWRQDIAAGGDRRDLAVARMLVGTGVGAIAAEMAATGLITGNGPADEQAAQLLRADGWQPYSIKLGDKYVSYSRLDPFATTLGVAAGMVELQDYMTEKQQDKVGALIAASVMQNLSSKTWLSGMSGLIEAVNDPTRYADTFLQRFASSFIVPAGVAQLARTVDPTMREAQSVLDAVRARVPGLSSSLEARRDIWGQPIVAEGGVGPDIISPVRQSTRRSDPVTNALLDAGVHLSKPQKKDMTPREYGQFQELSGIKAKGWIADLIAAADWKTMDTEDKQHEVFELLKAARKEAKVELFNSVNNDPLASSSNR
ncbi:thermonuclease family protein [Sphingobium phenoxybenzoativorans]|uniref:Thermonuclease family protein n=1 Tax=Sphingobium phenoxybenzoativorans TaxID=1592790 RepID=A0A975K5K0_9SPHN|nr:thermonuclease family protein [Sphingobium phenoxybenzoativorans]QUT05195.1 thermonuclease family protein [Sphingobium phenoxybenzoativorans]